jgi:acetyl esterase/lipase
MPAGPPGPESGDDGAVGYGFLALSVIGVLAVANAYRPLRREPLNAASFVAGWLVGELALQNLVLQAAVTVAFGELGAFARWPGWVGLALTGIGWAGLIGLAASGARASRVVAAALAGASGPPLPGVAVPTRPEWGRWWRLTRALPLRSRQVEVLSDLDYWGDGLHAHRLDVIRPRAPRPLSAGAPVMVYVHGGAWVMGDKREQGRPMMFELVARGWVCVAVNYRLSPRATWPEHVVDVKRALAWIKAHIAEYGGDPSFVALSGGSAGGHLCALAALTADADEWQPGFESADTAVQACVPFYGAMDLAGADGEYPPRLRSLLERAVTKVNRADDPDLFARASPTTRVHAGAPPFFVLHGANDSLVPVGVGRRFVAALRAVSSAPVAYAELPLAQHAFDLLASLRCQATTMGVVAFLESVRAGVGGPATPAVSPRPAER